MFMVMFPFHAYSNFHFGRGSILIYDYIELLMLFVEEEEEIEMLLENYLQRLFLCPI